MARRSKKTGKRSRTLTKRDQEIVFSIATGKTTVTTAAKKYKMNVGQIRGVVAKFAHTVLAPTTGEIALADPRMWMLGQMHAFNPSALVTRKGLGIFDEMRKDDQIKAAMVFKKLAATSSGWEVASPEEENKEHQPTKFIVNQFKTMERSLDDIIIEVLTALDFGYSVSEFIFEKVTVGEFTDLVGLKDIKTKAPHFLMFKIDKFGNLERDGIIQMTPDRGNVNLPVSKFLIFKYQSEFSNPYGRSDLESAYPRWWVKENAYRWLAMLLERFGIPPIFALYDPSTMNASQVQALRDAIERIQAATAGAIPRASSQALELWSPELAGQTGRVFIPALEMLNRDISRSLLMPGLLGLSPDQGVGSLARARVEFDVFVLMIERLRGQLAEAINHQIVHPLTDFNFGVQEEGYPEFRFMPLTNDMRIEMFRTWIQMVQVQAVKNTREDEAHIRKAFGFPMLEDVSAEGGGDLEGPPEPEPGPDEDLPPEDKKGSQSDLAPFGERKDDKLTGPFFRQLARPKKVLKLGQVKKTHVEHPNSHYYRAKTKFEKQVNFKQIETDLDDIEARALKSIVPQLELVKARFLKFIQSKFDYDARFVRGLKIRGMTAVSSQIADFLLTAYNAGAKTMASELDVKPQAKIAMTSQELLTSIKKHQETPDFRPRDAERYLKTKTFWITGVINAKLVEKSRGILLRAIQTGEALPKTIQKLSDIFDPYVGDPTVIRDDEVLTPYRLETIVRTNATDAFNQGRIVEARKAGELLLGFQYSAVLDQVTTDVCRELDGKVFRPNDPLLDQLRPPRHFSCRSVMVPIGLDEEVEEDDFISEAEAAEAMELSGEDFGGPVGSTGYVGAAFLKRK